MDCPDAVQTDREDEEVAGCGGDPPDVGQDVAEMRAKDPAPGYMT